MKTRCAAFLATMLMGCAPTVMQMSMSPGDMDQAAAMLGEGASTLKGSALVRQSGGGVVTCAGNDVYLIPATESAISELRRVFGDDKGYVPRGGDDVLGGGTVVVPPKPNRQGLCNAQGFFTFPNIRAGKWYVLTTVVWKVGDNYQGGTLLGSADVTEGRETEIVLSQ